MVANRLRQERLKRLPIDDETALMQLVLANAQGELAPLEIGVHALTVVGKGEPGRGKKGGLSEYARSINRDKSYISQLSAAAEVFQQAKSLGQPTIS